MCRCSADVGDFRRLAGTSAASRCWIFQIISADEWLIIYASVEVDHCPSWGREVASGDTQVALRPPADASERLAATATNPLWAGNHEVFNAIIPPLNLCRTALTQLETPSVDPLADPGSVSWTHVGSWWWNLWLLQTGRTDIFHLLSAASSSHKSYWRSVKGHGSHSSSQHHDEFKWSQISCVCV